MVLTTAVGGGYSDAAQHSQCLWGTFAHLPGMKVVVPSNPADAKGLMISAIRDDNPVVYMFHKGVMGLPWMAKNPRAIAEVPEGDYEVPIGKAAVAREGTRRHRRDAVPVGAPRPRRGRRSSSPEGIDVEVHRPAQPGAAGPRGDPRPRWPRPAGCVVVDEDYQSFGLSGEVAATVADHDPGCCGRPVGGSPSPTCPIPYARLARVRRAAPPGPHRGSDPPRGPADDRRPVPARCRRSSPTPRACWPPGSSRTATTWPKGSSSPRSGRQGLRRGDRSGGWPHPSPRRRGADRPTRGGDR